MEDRTGQGSSDRPTPLENLDRQGKLFQILIHFFLAPGEGLLQEAPGCNDWWRGCRRGGGGGGMAAKLGRCHFERFSSLQRYQHPAIRILVS